MIPSKASIVALLPLLRWRVDRARHAFNVWNRGGPEQGGYVHDTAMSIIIPPAAAQLTVGVFTDTVGSTALTYMRRRTAGAATNQLVIPIALPQNSVALKGSYLKTIDLYWKLGTATLTTLTALISKATLPLDTVAYAAPAALVFTYDSLNTSNDLYSQALAGWRTVTFKGHSRGGPTVEKLWMNYPAPATLHDPRYIGSNYRERERIRKQQRRWVERLARMSMLQRQALLAALDEAGIAHRQQ